MKNQTLKSYTQNKLKWYTNKYYDVTTFRLTQLLKLSLENKDVRLAEVSQAYFWTLKDYRAEKFSELTNEKFKDFNEFLSSNQKYVSEYNYELKKVQEDKNKYRKLLKVMLKRNNFSLYTVSVKFLKTNQSNVSRFFNKGENKTLSLEKLSKLYTMLYKYEKQKEKQTNTTYN